MRSPIDQTTTADQQGMIPSFAAVCIVIFDGWKSNLLKCINELKISLYYLNHIKNILSSGFFKPVSFPYPFCDPFLPNCLACGYFCCYPRPSWMWFLKVKMFETGIHPLAATIGWRVPPNGGTINPSYRQTTRRDVWRVPKNTYFFWNGITVIIFWVLNLLVKQIPFFCSHGWMPLLPPGFIGTVTNEWWATMFLVRSGHLLILLIGKLEYVDPPKRFCHYYLASFNCCRAAISFFSSAWERRS